MKSLWREILPALLLSAATLVLTGVAYPLVMTGLAQLFFAAMANGSLVRDGAGRIVGSALIGQAFASPAYFQPRPSAAGQGYDAAASSGSNFGPTSAKLRDRARAEIEHQRKENPDAPGPVPADLVEASGSGLDPDITGHAALWQAPRVARARAVALADVEALVAGRTEPRTIGLFGEPRVNVLLLNLDLDTRFGAPRAREPEASRRASPPR